MLTVVYHDIFVRMYKIFLRDLEVSGCRGRHFPLDGIGTAEACPWSLVSDPPALMAGRAGIAADLCEHGRWNTASVLQCAGADACAPVCCMSYNDDEHRRIHQAIMSDIPDLAASPPRRECFSAWPALDGKNSF